MHYQDGCWKELPETCMAIDIECRSGTSVQFKNRFSWVQDADGNPSLRCDDCQVDIYLDWDMSDYPVPYCFESDNCKQVYWSTMEFINNKEPLKPTQCSHIYLSGTDDVTTVGTYIDSQAPGYTGALATPFIYSVRNADNRIDLEYEVTIFGQRETSPSTHWTFWSPDTAGEFALLFSQSDEAGIHASITLGSDPTADDYVEVSATSVTHSAGGLTATATNFIKHASCKSGRYGLLTCTFTIDPFVVPRSSVVDGNPRFRIYDFASGSAFLGVDNQGAWDNWQSTACEFYDNDRVPMGDATAESWRSPPATYSAISNTLKPCSYCALDISMHLHESQSGYLA
jgi:hypothetical protein